MIFTFSKEDASYFRKMGCNKTIEVVPMMVDLDDYEYRPGFHEYQIGFIGSLEWMPNLEGLNWFLKIWKKFNERNTHWQLNVAGRGMPAHIKSKKLPKTRMRGEVDDAHAFVQNQDVIVVPLLSGSGIRIKILEAMSMGKCVLSTSIGAEGIPASDGKEILIADSENEIISCLNALEMDPKRIQEIGSAARNFIKAYFEHKTIMVRVLNAFERFLNEKRDIH